MIIDLRRKMKHEEIVLQKRVEIVEGDHQSLHRKADN